jgi:hypothetical protein
VCTFEKALFIFIVLMAAWSLTAGPEPPSVHIRPIWNKVLTYFCKPILLSVHDVISSSHNCRGVNKLLAVEAESWFSAMNSVCCKPFDHLRFLDVSSDCVESVSSVFPILNPYTPFMVSCGGEIMSFVSSQ